MKKCCPGFPIAFIVVFVVGAFLYYYYSFSAVAEVDFKNNSFYATNNQKMFLFEPKDKEYKMCFFSSYVPKWQEALELKSKKTKLTVLAVDLYQQGESYASNVINLKVSSEVMLSLVHKFELKAIPRCFIIKQDKENLILYRHLKSSGIYKILNFKQTQGE